MKEKIKIACGVAIVCAVAFFSYRAERDISKRDIQWQKHIDRVTDMIFSFQWERTGAVTVDNYSAIEIVIDQKTFDLLREGFQKNQETLKAKHSAQVVLNVGEKSREMTFDEFLRLIDGAAVEGEATHDHLPAAPAKIDPLPNSPREKFER